MKRTAVRLPDATYARLKALAARSGRTFSLDELDGSPGVED